MEIEVADRWLLFFLYFKPSYYMLDYLGLGIINQMKHNMYVYYNFQIPIGAIFSTFNSFL